MKALVFICEWWDKEFLRSLFQSKYGLISACRNNVLYSEEKQSIFIFAHPHNSSWKVGKCAFLSPDTYVSSRIRSLSIIQSLWKEFTSLDFLVLRDADWIEVDWDVFVHKIEDISRTCEDAIWIKPKVFFAKEMIENWYLAWTPLDSLIFDKNTHKLINTKNIDRLSEAKKIVNDRIAPEYKNLTFAQAQKFWEIYDLALAKTRSPSFSDFINFIDSFYMI